MAQSSRTDDRNEPTGRPEAREPRPSYIRLGIEVRGGRIGAVYQRLRNPSTRTGILIVLFAVLLVSAPFIPQWVRTTQEGLTARRESQERFEAGLISEELLIPSQVLPYLNRRVVQMASADSPVDWYVIDFVGGPCSEPHFIQMKEGKYRTALETGCGEIHAVQLQYAASCQDAASCEVPLEARTRLLESVAGMYEQFSDAGLVLPYSFEEQVIGP